MKLGFIHLIDSRNKRRPIGVVLVFLLLVYLAPLPVRPQSKSQKRIISVRASDAAEGSRITIVSDAALNDYEAYQHGNNFYVKIPAAGPPAAQANIRGRGVEDVQIQKLGDSAILSLRLQPGTTARVEQRFNRLAIVVKTLPKSQGAASGNTGGAEATSGNSLAANPGNSPAQGNGTNATGDQRGESARDVNGSMSNSAGASSGFGGQQGASLAPATGTQSPRSEQAAPASLASPLSQNELSHADERSSTSSRATESASQESSIGSWVPLVVIVLLVFGLGSYAVRIRRRLGVRSGNVRGSALMAEFSGAVNSSAAPRIFPALVGKDNGIEGERPGIEEEGARQSAVELARRRADADVANEAPLVMAAESGIQAGQNSPHPPERARLPMDEELFNSAQEQRQLLETARQRKKRGRKAIEKEARVRPELGDSGATLERAEEESRQRAEKEQRIRLEIEELHRAEAEQRRRIEEAEARRQAEEQSEEEARLKAAEEAWLKAAEEARLKAEAEARLKAAEEARLKAAEEARLQAAEEAWLKAAEEARLKAEEEARLKAAEEARLKAEEKARQKAGEEVRLKAAEEARLKAEEEARLKAEEKARLKAAEEARLKAAEAARLKAKEAPVQAEQTHEVDSDARAERGKRHSVKHKASEVVEGTIEAGVPTLQAAEAPWEDVRIEHSDVEARTVEFSAQATVAEVESEALTVKEIALLPIEKGIAPFGYEWALPGKMLNRLHSEEPEERAAAVADLARIGGEDSFHCISRAFDDPAPDVRDAAAWALYNLQNDRAASFTRALREGSPERRRNIGVAMVTSGLTADAIDHLSGVSREKTYDAFSLLFLMAKAGEVQPLLRAIEDNPNLEVRLAIVHLLSLSGHPETLPAFRRLAVRSSLPSEVRSAVTEAIYQISAQMRESAPSAA